MKNRQSHKRKRTSKPSSDLPTTTAASSEITAREPSPLPKLTKDIPWSWGAQQQEAFDKLKAEFQKAPILAQWDRTLLTLLETDASNQAVAGVLSQLHPANPEDPTSKPEWKLVDCHATTLKESERNWPIHDKELWGIISSILHWHS